MLIAPFVTVNILATVHTVNISDTVTFVKNKENPKCLTL
jgi:hypothetical protein